ncbi:GlxA family transcriptional regulator [Propionibacterium australiense]|uniref:Class I glutamine amidotransferase-like n=1 Tax=Propionibacterium australiense TaxID=119981 RepID=A0A383S575_9ACTN|nr:helix-turn-helix domain-containing protein [Propionibacterium australiense]RLP07026.1 helix-turn-helix domain-containing protein [Propionibacterium australiense]RLP07062.1 helix-turn-helix domain-containing protein [Propionibacterium australiense]SYZ33135.1 Class I glutamine amidotransferase-like [Propionibacterium australiense]VEH89151.1 Regulatory protein soxS [Propionibacterium australiense]
MTRIAVHAFEGISLFHLAAPLTVFGEVARLGLAEWETLTWSEDGAPVRTAEGLAMSELAGAEAVAAADMVVFPSWPAQLPAASEALVSLIGRAHRAGAVIVGLCLGAFPVAQSGLLDGRRAVTHWAAADQLAEACPRVDVDATALYIDHGNVMTSAGTAAALDACLHIVRDRLGSATAATVARRLVIAPHREGDQAQYITRPMATSSAGEGLGAVVAWMHEHLGQPITVKDLAEVGNMSPRHLARRFQAEFGTSPGAWLRSCRLDEARRLLETTDWPISRVARACGYASPVTFRQRFAAAFATTPTAYRRRFSEPPLDH